MSKDSLKVFSMPFSRVYPLYLQKVERKGRSKTELDEVVRWLTGYGQKELQEKTSDDTDLAAFFEQAPQINPCADKVTGVVCGVRVEAVEDPLMRNIRRLDKLVDELAKGKPLEKVLRS